MSKTYSNHALSQQDPEIAQFTELLKNTFLDSRYPKIIYAYKEFYGTLKKIYKLKTITTSNEVSLSNIKNQMEEESLLFSNEVEHDLFISIHTHGLIKYEKIIKDFILICKVYSIEHYIEANLEYVEFLIRFKLKPDKFNKKVFYHKNKKVTKDKLSSEYTDYKIDIIKQITDLICRLDPHIMHLKEKTTYHQIKHIIEMRNSMKKKDSSMTETPPNIIIQKFYYLKGLFCYYCEEYFEAIYHFQKSKVFKIISDAVIINDSIRKISKIIKKLMEHIVELKPDEIDRFTIMNATTFGNNNTLNPQHNFFNEIKSSKLKYLDNILSNCENEMAQFSNSEKEVIILLNMNIFTIEKNKIQSIRIIRKIYEDYISENEKFGVFGYDDELKFLINVTKKTSNSFNFIFEEIEKLAEIEVETQSLYSLLNRLIEVTNYVTKKKLNSKLHTWIIIISDSLSIDDDASIRKNSYFSSKQLNIRNDQSSYITYTNFIFIKLRASYHYLNTGELTDREVELNEEHAKGFKNKFKLSKSEIIYSNKLYELSFIMSSLGSITNNNEFMFEKYQK